jgi:hypothetical protein
MNDDLNILRAFVSTDLGYTTGDSILPNGRLAKKYENADWLPAYMTEMGRLYAEDLEEMAGNLGTQVCLLQVADIRLRTRRAQGFMHVGVKEEWGIMSFTLDEPDIWKQVKINRPSMFNAMVAKCGQVKCPPLGTT